MIIKPGVACRAITSIIFNICIRIYNAYKHLWQRDQSRSRNERASFITVNFQPKLSIYFQIIN